MSVADEILNGPNPRDEISELKKTVKSLEETIGKQNEKIKRLSKPRIRIQVDGPGLSGRTTKTRVIVPDSHGIHINKQAASAFLSDLKRIRPAEIVFIGDHLDCGGFLAEHHTLSYVPETDYTFEDDQMAANQFLDQIHECSPHSESWYIEGNHERRIEKWILDKVTRNPRDAKYFHSHFSTATVLNLETRGLHHIKQSECYQGIDVPGVIKLGNCYFTHGIFSGKNAVYKMIERFAANVVFGHIHRLLYVLSRTVSGGEIGGWCCGYLADLQPFYAHQKPTDWTRGYGLQMTMDDGDFLHLNVPIIGGNSLLLPLADMIGQA